MKLKLDEKTKENIKHAIVSLILGIITTATTTLLLGLAHILTAWVAGTIGGTATSLHYLHQKNLL